MDTEFKKATGTGRMVDLLNPKPEQIDLEDIVVALAGINRWAGTTGHFFSVASHSLLVGREFLKIRPEATGRELAAALLHDAHEAYTGDITTPLKRVLRLYTGALDDLQKRFDAVIFEKFDCYPDDDVYDAIKVADQISWGLESWALFDCDFDPEWRPEGQRGAAAADIRLTEERRSFAMLLSLVRDVLAIPDLPARSTFLTAYAYFCL